MGRFRQLVQEFNIRVANGITRIGISDAVIHEFEDNGMGYTHHFSKLVGAHITHRHFLLDKFPERHLFHKLLCIPRLQ